MAITPNSKYDYPLTQQANIWVLDKILNVDKIVVQTKLDMAMMTYKVEYACIKKDKVVLKIAFDDDVPLQDRVTAMQVALRMNDGNDIERKEGGTS